MIDRRKFLGRSVLSAGSVIFSSSLLQSCTKYGIILPGRGTDTGIVVGQPPPTPPLGDPGLTWNDAAKEAVVTGLGMIPEGGEILGALVSVFWPSSTDQPVDIWGQVRGQVEALIDQKIADDVYLTVQGNLQGLNNDIANYRDELRNGSSIEILINWISLKNAFALYLPNFQKPGYELLLLPLFAQFANMYLSILRDAVLFGRDWGRTDSDYWQDIQFLFVTIGQFEEYAQKTYDAGLTNVQKNTQRNDQLCEPFKSVNTYVRQMTLMVLDFKDSWGYFDASRFYNPVTVELTREIYSDPMGSLQYSSNQNPIVMPSPPPTQRPTQLSLWG